MSIARLGTVVLTCALAGCAASPPRAVSAPASSPSSKQHVPSATCTATLLVHSVQVRPGCTIDERVTQAPGQVVFPCAGPGPASATFGASRFVGQVRPDGELDLVLETGFDFSDGCHWTTKQQITGRIGAPAWSYAYREEPDRGQRGCAAGCVATATVRVTR